jgi:hypothetical protein
VGNSHESRRAEGISGRGQNFMSCRADNDNDYDDYDDDNDDNTIPQINVQIWPLSKM